MFKIFRKNCYGLDVHKTLIYACIGITDNNGRTEYKQARFSSFSKGLKELLNWLVKYNCFDVCMESTGKYWIPVFNILELVQIANALLKSKEHPEFGERYRRIKASRGHKKAIISICRMLLTAIWHILKKMYPILLKVLLN